MNALRIEQDVVDHQLVINLPENFYSPRVEIIILPIGGDLPEESKKRMEALGQTGFIQQVVAGAEEDVWNDL